MEYHIPQNRRNSHVGEQDLRRISLWSRLTHQVNELMALRKWNSRNPMNRVSALAIGSVERIRKPIPLGAIALVRRIIDELRPTTMRTTTGIRNRKAMGPALGAARTAKFEGMVP